MKKALCSVCAEPLDSSLVTRGAHLMCALPGEEFSESSGHNLKAERAFKKTQVSSFVSSSTRAILSDAEIAKALDRADMHAPFIEDFFVQESFDLDLPSGGRFR